MPTEQKNIKLEGRICPSDTAAKIVSMRSVYKWTIFDLFWLAKSKSTIMVRHILLLSNIVEFDTGCSDWKLSKANGCRIELKHFWPYVGKAKMRFRGGKLFIWQKINKQLKIVNKFSNIEKIYWLSNAFWFYQHRVKSASIQFYSHLLFTIFYRNTLY